MFVSRQDADELRQPHSARSQVRLLDWPLPASGFSAGRRRWHSWRAGANLAIKKMIRAAILFMPLESRRQRLAPSSGRARGSLRFGEREREDRYLNEPRKRRRTTGNKISPPAGAWLEEMALRLAAGIFAGEPLSDEIRGSRDGAGRNKEEAHATAQSLPKEIQTTFFSSSLASCSSRSRTN